MNNPTESRIAILSLIDRINSSFDGSAYVYNNGSCIKFAMILLEVFPEGKILYDCNHAIFMLDGECYDVLGIAKKTDRHIPIEDYGPLKMHDLMSMKCSIYEDINLRMR